MGYLMNQFKKATLSVALATTLATGFVATPANAQTVPVGGGATYTQVDQQQQRKPWENDPSYVRQVEATQRVIDANILKARANEKAQLAAAQQRYSAELQREAQWLARMRANPNTKWTDYQALAAQQNTALANYNAQQVTIKANTDGYVAGQEAAMETYIVRLDSQFERMPQYKAILDAQRNAGKPVVTTTQPTTKPAAQQLPAANQALTPQQQHDRLVRAYQDAQLRSAQSGGKVAAPNPADYGLDAKDPAIAPQPGGRSP